MNDAIIKIFGYLNIADRFTVWQVCREWRQLVNSRGIRRPEMGALDINFVSHEDFAKVKFHGKIFQIRFPSNWLFDTDNDHLHKRNLNLDVDMCHKMENLLSRYGRYVEEIRLCKTCCRYIPTEIADIPLLAEISPAFLMLIVLYCRNVHTMTFKNVTFKKQMLDCLTGKNFPQLKVLRFNDIDLKNDEDELIRFMTTAPKVKKLNFRSASVELFKALTSNHSVSDLNIKLNEFQFANGFHMNTEVVDSLNNSPKVQLILPIHEHNMLAAQFLQSLKTVTKLDIRTWSNDNLHYLCNAVAALKNTLSVFVLRGFESRTLSSNYWVLNDQFFDHLTQSLQKCKKLKSCSLIRCCRNVKNFKPLLIIDVLEEFVINGARRLKCAILEEFVITSPKLRILVVRCCPHIGGDDIVQIMNSSNTLEDVEFVYCGHLSQNVGECLSYVRLHGSNLQLCHLKGMGILEWDDSIKAKLRRVYQLVNIKGGMDWEDEDIGTLILWYDKTQNSRLKNFVEGGLSIINEIECCDYCTL